MPNFDLTINSTFQPFSYEELLTPVKAYTEAADKAEIDALTLEEKLDSVNLDNLDEDSLKDYYAFRSRLNGAFSSLEGGFNSNSFNAIKQLKRDYNRSIKPIIEASNKIETARLFRNELESKSPGVMFEEELPTVDSIINGNNISNKYYDPSIIANSVAKLVIPEVSTTLSDKKTYKDVDSTPFDINKIFESITSKVELPSNGSLDSMVLGVINDTINDLKYDKKVSIYKNEELRRGNLISGAKSSGRKSSGSGKTDAYDSYIKDPSTGEMKLNSTYWQLVDGESVPLPEYKDMLIKMKKYTPKKEVKENTDVKPGKTWVLITSNGEVYYDHNDEPIKPRVSGLTLVTKRNANADEEEMMEQHPGANLYRGTDANGNAVYYYNF